MATGTQLEKSTPIAPVPKTLAGRLSALWSFGRLWWVQLPARQRGWTLTAAVLLTAMLGSLAWFGLRTDWRTLYVNLDSDDARQIADALAAAQIPYEATADGTGIRVPAAQLDKARLAAASKGSVKNARLGFELFDKPNWVGSEFDEQVNYQRALEGELEHTIGTLADVASARVHLVLLHDSLFRDEERPAKASVVLKLRHHGLADGEPEAIRNLVASAVDGLSPERVVLVDAAGNLPLGPKTAEAVRLSDEEALEEKLTETLEPVTGAGNVRASVTLDYDDTSTETTQESYDPDKTVTLSMQRTEQSTGAQQTAAGVPGTASNTPNSSAKNLPVYPGGSTPPQSAKTESGTYGASKTERHVVEAPGKLRRMTAAIVVNDRLVQAASGKKPAIWKPRSADELRNLTALAQAAVGYDVARGDVLTVQDLAFDENRSQTPVPLYQQIPAEIQSSALLIKYAALLAGLAAVLFFGVRPALRHAATAVAAAGVRGGRELTAGAQAQGALHPPAPPEVDPERIRTQQIFEQVTSQVKREPTQSSRLLQSWIHSE